MRYFFYYVKMRYLENLVVKLRAQIYYSLAALLNTKVLSLYLTAMSTRIALIRPMCEHVSSSGCLLVTCRYVLW